MKLYKNKNTGAIIIWNESYCKQYYFYPKRDAIKLFKNEYKVRGKVTEVECFYGHFN